MKPKEPSNRPNRRDFLKTAAAVTGAVTAAPALVRGQTAEARRVGPPAGMRPRRVVFLVSDGMSLGVPSMAEPFSRLVRGRGTHLMKLYESEGVARGLMETRSLNSPVTDSSAAACAWGAGARIFNGAVNVLPDGRELKPICRTAKEAGLATGLVSTTRMTHATPAGFAAVSKSRDDENAIARQYTGVVDVLLGGGLSRFDPAMREDGRDLIAEYRKAGYAFWDRRDETLTGTPPARVLGLFASSHMPYSIDRRNDPALWKSTPSLAEMTLTALRALHENPNGFLLQVEGGRIDHAAHANDAAACLWDQLAFDDALGVVLEYVRENPDTLVIATTDHGNANPGLNGMGGGYLDSERCFRRLADARGSFGKLWALLNEADKAPGPARRAVRETLGLDFTEDEARIAACAAKGELPEEMNVLHRNFAGVLGQIAGNHNGVGWTGTNHTQDAVVLAAVGPESESLAGWVRNTDCYKTMTAALGLEYENPSMTPEEAEKHLAAAPSYKHALRA